MEHKVTGGDEGVVQFVGHDDTRRACDIDNSGSEVHGRSVVVAVAGEDRADAFAAGIWPKRAAALEVRGRRSGRVISLPVVMADYDDERYLVSMLGEKANWVRNVRAAGGHAVLRHGRREAVHLEEVPAEARSPILRRYLERAPGARPDIPIDRHAPPEAFEGIAPEIPVFRITTEPPGRA